MPVALVTNSTHVFAHPPASPPESQVTHALGCVTHSLTRTSTQRTGKNGAYDFTHRYDTYRPAKNNNNKKENNQLRTVTLLSPALLWCILNLG